MVSAARGVREPDLQPNSPASSKGAALERVGGASDTSASGSVQDVRVNHRRLQVPVTQKLLDRADIVALFEQVGRERMPKRMTARGLLDAHVPYCLRDRALDIPVLEVMPADDARARDRTASLGRAGDCS